MEQTASMASPRAKEGKTKMIHLFRGRYDCKVDSKGRLSLPAPYRAGLEASASTEFVITNNKYQNQALLDVYTLREWEKLENKIAAMPSFKPQVQAYKRFYMASGQVVQADAQSRILIPAALRKFANLQDEVVLVGMGGKFEVWNTADWNQLYDGSSNDLESIMSQMAELEGLGA